MVVEQLLLASICLKSQTAWMGSLLLIAVAGFRGFSWMIVLALCFRPSKQALKSFSCSFSSCRRSYQNLCQETLVHFTAN